jgi:hypothetical protein
LDPKNGIYFLFFPSVNSIGSFAKFSISQNWKKKPPIGKFLGIVFIIDFEIWVYFSTMVFVFGRGLGGGIVIPIGYHGKENLTFIHDIMM